jgi:glucose-1-phosphate thymidylyltransferase
MKAIIPAAGSGTRLRPHTHTMPKPLVYVAGKPILGHILDNLENTEIDRIGFIVGDKGEKITEYVESHYDFKLDHVYQEERKGLGHAIYLYLKEKGFDDEPVLIILSDTILEADLAEILDSQYSSIGVHKVDDPKQFGIVEPGVRFIRGLEEKPNNPKSDLAIVGIYLINNVRLLFECLQQLIDEDRRTRGEYQLTDALQLMLDNGEKMTTFFIEGWYDCGSKKNLLDTQRHLLEKAGKSYEIPGSIIVTPVSIADSDVVENSIVGPHVSIADGAQVTKSIIEDAIINENASISNALIRESLIGENAIFDGQFSRLNIGDSSEITFG